MQNIRASDVLSQCRLCDISGHHKINIWDGNERNIEFTLSEKISECIGLCVCELEYLIFIPSIDIKFKRFLHYLFRCEGWTSTQNYVNDVSRTAAFVNYARRQLYSIHKCMAGDWGAFINHDLNVRFQSVHGNFSIKKNWKNTWRTNTANEIHAKDKKTFKSIEQAHRQSFLWKIRNLISRKQERNNL